jgi:putative transposase
MRKSRFTEAQITHILGQAEAGVPQDELYRKYGISSATFYRWKQKFGGMTPSEMQRLKTLEQENKKLKALVADLSLDKQILKEALAGKL